jgi:hypothetical protein
MASTSLFAGDFIMKAVSAHANVKLSLLVYADKNPQSPVSFAYTTAGRIVQKLETDTLQATYNSAPSSVVSLVRDYFWTMPTLFAASYLKGMASYQQVLAVGTTWVLSDLNKDIRCRPLVRDLAIASAASHSWGFVSNTIDCVAHRDPTAGATAVLNAFCAVKAGLIVVDKDKS